MQFGKLVWYLTGAWSRKLLKIIWKVVIFWWHWYSSISTGRTEHLPTFVGKVSRTFGTELQGRGLMPKGRESTRNTEVWDQSDILSFWHWIIVSKSNRYFVIRSVRLIVQQNLMLQGYLTNTWNFETKNSKIIRHRWPSDIWEQHQMLIDSLEVCWNQLHGWIKRSRFPSNSIKI